jgi:hypothetical protein
MLRYKKNVCSVSACDYKNYSLKTQDEMSMPLVIRTFASEPVSWLDAHYLNSYKHGSWVWVTDCIINQLELLSLISTPKKTLTLSSTWWYQILFLLMHPCPIRIILNSELTRLHPTRFQYKDRTHRPCQLICSHPITEVRLKKLWPRCNVQTYI